MPSALFQLSPSSEVWLAPDVSLAGANVLTAAPVSSLITARLADQAGVGTVVWTITSLTLGATAPTITTSVSKEASFVVSRNVPAAYILEARVNGGINPLTGETDPALVKTLAIKVATIPGAELIAPGETTEAHRAVGWTDAFNRLAALPLLQSLSEAFEGVRFYLRNGFVHQRSETVSSLTTNSTVAVTAWQWPVQLYQSGSITVQAIADNGTTTDETVWKCTFRRYAGAATISRAGVDLSAAGFANGHSVTFTLSGNTLQANVKAGAATPTKWGVAIGVLQQNIS